MLEKSIHYYKFETETNNFCLYVDSRLNLWTDFDKIENDMEIDCILTKELGYFLSRPLGN